MTGAAQRMKATRVLQLLRCLALLMAALAVEGAVACINATAFGTVTAPTNNTPLTISTCTFQSEYNTINGIVAGATYQVTSSCGGYITVRRGTPGGIIVAQGNSPVSFTAPVAGTYYLHFNTNAACGTASVCCTTTITCTSCTGTTGCVNTVAFGTVTAPVNTTPLTISTCTYQTEYNTINAVVAGATYTVANSCGGYITVRQSTFNGPVVAQGNAPLTFTAPANGTYFVHYNTSAACGTASNCCTTTVTCTSCTVTPPAGACTAVNLPSLPVANQAVVCHASNLLSLANIANICGSASTLYLGGNEALYTVTPTVTGNYAINYTGQSYSSIWVFSGACPGAGGLCQGSVSGTGAVQNLTVAMTAGVQYWILFDTWPSPPSPCPGTFSITTSSVPPPVVASDCNQAVNVCTNINFQIDPNGFGTVNEVPPLGSLGNPDYLTDGVPSPWGTDNWGCLRSGELNSTWMVVNVLTGGSLEFTFGGLGTQGGFYDWIMYPYNASACSQVAANTLVPVRCNWNGVAFGGTGLAAALPPGGDATNFEPPLMVGSYTQWLICFSNWSSVTTAVPLQFGGTAVVSCSPLAVELLSFEAQRRTGGVQLEWVTAAERNASRFVVERSSDAEAWMDVATVAAHGESHATLVYKTEDRQAPYGQLFYRLRMVDVDGSFVHSPVRTVGMAGGHTVVPNPATDGFTVMGVPEGAHVELLDALGREVPVRWERHADGAMHASSLDAVPGLYSVRVAGHGAVAVTRLLLQR